MLCGATRDRTVPNRLSDCCIMALGVFAGAMTAAPARAAPTPAGTIISNTAKATYDLSGGVTATVDSNTVSLTVDEILDVAVASLDAGDVTVSPGSTGGVLTFKVTNGGNGQESFRLSAVDNATGDDFDPTTTAIVLDSNNNGTYDPGTDTVYVAGSNDPSLAPNASRTIFLVSTIPSNASNGARGEADLVAQAVTGTGAPGTVFAGQGQGGGDAITGSTTAKSTAHGFYAVSAANVSLVKSAAVADPFGGTGQVPGSTITYTLVASIGGGGTLNNVTLSDSVPAGTTYQPGSLTLGGSTLTDSADADSGEVVAGNLTVRLGNLAAGSSRTVTFKVKVD
jgi:uncharacterized repeat protein (TIGR01451 family)